MIQHSLYYSNFIIKNLSYIISDLKFGLDIYLKDKERSSKNITWDYETYNIFNLCTNRKNIRHLKKIVFNYIKCYLDEFEIQYDKGILFNSWINFHQSDEEFLKIHGHDSFYHGYICIDPLDTSTIFLEPITNETELIIKNEPGLIYIGENSQNSFHFVKSNSKIDRPRITLAFNFNNLNQISNFSNNFSPQLSSEIIFL